MAGDLREWIKVKRGTASQSSTAKEATLGPNQVVDIATLPGFWAVVLWRLANALHHRGLRPLSRLIYFANMVLFGADLAPGGVVGPGVVMPHPVGVAVASDVVFGARCRIMGSVRLGGGGAGKVGHPVIGNDVWLLDGAKAFGPVTIGNRSVIGANALISRDVPADTMVLVPKNQLETRSYPRRPLEEAS